MENCAYQARITTSGQNAGTWPSFVRFFVHVILLVVDAIILSGKLAEIEPHFFLVFSLYHKYHSSYSS